MITSLLIAALSLFNYVSSPLVDMREHPKQDSEIVSQAYYSEEVNVLAEDQDWLKIETVADHYQGWIQKNALTQRQNKFLSDPAALVAKVSRLAAHIYHVQDTVYGPLLTVPFDSKLEVLEPLEPSNSRWLKVLLVDGREAYIQRGDVKFDHSPLDRDNMLLLSFEFLGLPYTWGGRSSFGYDCSGFVQMLYRQMGLAMPRDSKDQIRWDKFASVSLDELAPGDLVFFGLAVDKIRHVGLYIGDNQFIHSTVQENRPYIHISRLSDPDWNGSGRFAYRAGRRLKDI